MDSYNLTGAFALNADTKTCAYPLLFELIVRRLLLVGGIAFCWAKLPLRLSA